VSTINYIKEWLRRVNEIQLNKAKHKGKDIRNFFIQKSKCKINQIKNENEGESEFEEQSKGN